MIRLIKYTFYHENETKKKLADFVVKSKRLSFGSECESFERNFAKYQGRKDAVMFNSGSSANLALIRALLNLGILRKGDAVGFSATTWSTNVMPLIEMGLEPVPVDVEIETLNVSSETLKKAFKRRRLKGFFLTNALGFCDDIDNIKTFCKRNKIVFIEDNCEALGSVFKRKKLGNFGLAGTFSFYVGHHMPTIEGGAVATDDKELAAMLRIVRAHGWDRNLKEAESKKLRRCFKITSPLYAKYTFYDLGYNLRPTEIQGFLGKNQLKFLPEIVKKRQNNFISIGRQIYRMKNKYVPIEYGHMDVVSNFTFPVVCRSGRIMEELVKKCDKKIEIRPLIAGDITRQPFFKKYVKRYADSKMTPNAKIIHERGIYFANHPDLSAAEKKTIIDVFSKG
ncbi:MAG: DegT/DnrJ/EryC1/StrS aminotransferase family protein [Candidatus Liptonbacteria bacterium]|nr:DegT/DnrJ/EryC1/StrS aminotransferase family protein [Candidatus Liptonbacteria bacterium]